MALLLVARTIERHACMDDEEHERWVKLNPTNGVERARAPCDDCIVGFALEMRAIGRCDGVPAGVEDDEPMPRGPAQPSTYMTEQRKLGVAKRRRERRNRVETAARLFRAGLTRAEIAETMGCSTSTITHYLLDREAAA